MRKKHLIFTIAFTLVAIIGGIVVIVFKGTPITVNDFTIDDYQCYVDNYSTSECLGLFADSKELIEKVEEFWIKKYGENVKNQKPYQIFFDEENEVWLVQGTLRSNEMGGVANIIVENSTGKILALWHEK